jgi:hypothetical protein
VRELFTMRKRIGMAAGLILLALIASLVLSRARNGPAALSSLRFNEIDMGLVDLEPQTFEVKLDREFLY